MSILEWVGLAVSIGTLITMLFIVYRSFRDPGVKNDKKIALLEQKVELQSLATNKDFGFIIKSLHLLKVNDIAHIEGGMKDLNEKMIKVITILDRDYEVVKK